jgi:hypothetical protein
MKLLGAVLMATSWSAPVYAETICNYVPTSAEMGVPMDQRESIRSAQSRIVPEVLSKADALAEVGQLSESVDAYFSVFQGQKYNVSFWTGFQRCLSASVYQRAANGLRTVASELATQLMAKGVYEGQWGPDNGPAALRLLLMSNQYDAFERHAFEYAVKELPKKDVDPTYLAQSRLNELQQTREVGAGYSASELVNDLTPLLDEELAAFDKLPGFKSRLQARLAPLYPKLADDVLAAEARHYDEAVKTDGMLPRMMIVSQATGALDSGIKRLEQHPKLTARLQQRANERGDALLKMDDYGSAQEYFEIAGNEKQAEIARGLAESQQEAKLEEVKTAVESDIEKMRKSKEEKAAFQDEADDMAAEFGFDLED